MSRRVWVSVAAPVALAAGVAFLGTGLSRPSIRMDGHGYYAPLASAVFDGDLDLADEFAHADRHMRQTYFVLADGRTANPFAVGAAILWAPAVLAAQWTDPSAVGHRDPARWRYASPAYLPRYVRAIAIATGLEALLAAGILWVALRRRTGPVAATWGTAAAVLGTPLVYYALAEPSYAHTASFLAATCLLACVLGRAPLVLQGAAWGLCALVRWQDAVLGLLLLPRLASELRTPGPRGLLRVAACITAAAVVFLPQMLLWQRMYGRFVLVPMGSGFLDWLHPRLPQLLFSTWHGAFLWSPVLVLGFAGLLRERHRASRAAAWAAIAAAVYVSACVADWWGSAGFGARRLVSLAPLCGWGVALLFDGARGRRRVALAAATTVAMAWNLRLAHYDVRGLIPNNPGNVVEYQRQHPAGDPRTSLYGLWDYERLFCEFLDAERELWRR